MLLLATAIVLLVIPPLAGVLVSGRELAPYLEFPPVTQYVQHAPFSWTVFGAMLAGVAVFCVLFYFPQTWDTRRVEPEPFPEDPGESPRPMPWWGWAGLALCAVAWVAAWTRPAFLGDLRRHTFAPLWFGFILVLDGLVNRRRGTSMLTRAPRGFAWLFPASAAAWWFFEYLNRFVQNWHYSQDVNTYTPLQYFLLATPPFATVLPAVFEAAELLGTTRCIRRRYRTEWQPPDVPRPLLVALIVIGVAGQAGIAVWPDQLYPLLWLAPLFVAAPLLTMARVPTPFRAFRAGDWRPLVCLSLGALLCGLFWEMWNFHSLPKWYYSVPFVQRFHVFEMPLLGFAGYLPFGVECYCLFALVRHAFPCRAFDNLRAGGFDLPAPNTTEP